MHYGKFSSKEFYDGNCKFFKEKEKLVEATIVKECFVVFHLGAAQT